MQILIGNFSLTAGGDGSPENLRVNGQRQVQTAAFLRTASAGVFARGDRVNTVSFATTREHASYGAQVSYAAQASAVAADEGTQQGVTTTHVYTLVCGAIRGGELNL